MARIRSVRLVLLLLPLLVCALAAPTFAQSGPEAGASPAPAASPVPAASPDADAELPDDGSKEGSDLDIPELIDGEVEITHQTEEDVQAAMAEVEREGLTSSDREAFPALYERYTTEEMPLDADQEAYFKALFWMFTRQFQSGQGHIYIDTPNADKLRNLFRLYVYQACEFGGLRLEGAAALAAREESSLRNETLEIRTVLPKIEVLAQYRTILGNWSRTQHYRNFSDYAKAIAVQLQLWRNNRGIAPDNLLIVYMLWKYPNDFYMDRLNRWLSDIWIGRPDPIPEGFASDIFTSKTTPSLQFNNEVAQIISKKLTWEELGMDKSGGNAVNNWMARQIYTHQETIQWIPLLGSLVSAADSLITLIDGKDASGAQASRWLAAGSFVFNYAMAVCDVYLVAGGVKLAGIGARAAFRGVKGGSQAITKAGRTFFTNMKSGVSAFRQTALTAGKLKDVIRCELKLFRNKLCGAPKTLAQKAQAAAGKYVDDLKALRKARTLTDNTFPSKACAVVDRKTGREFVGRSAKGIEAERAAVEAHPRMVQLEEVVTKKVRAAGGNGRSLEGWNFRDCAEWDAMNQALKAGADIEDLIVYTVKTNASKTLVVPCKNCSVTTLGAIVVK